MAEMQASAGWVAKRAASKVEFEAASVTDRPTVVRGLPLDYFPSFVHPPMCEKSIVQVVPLSTFVVQRSVCRVRQRSSVGLVV